MFVEMLAIYNMYFIVFSMGHVSKITLKRRVVNNAVLRIERFLDMYDVRFIHFYGYKISPSVNKFELLNRVAVLPTGVVINTKNNKYVVKISKFSLSNAVMYQFKKINCSIYNYAYCKYIVFFDEEKRIMTIHRYLRDSVKTELYEYKFKCLNLSTEPLIQKLKIGYQTMYIIVPTFTVVNKIFVVDEEELKDIDIEYMKLTRRPEELKPKYKILYKNLERALKYFKNFIEKYREYQKLLTK